MADDEQKIFSLTEAERLRAQLEPVLIEAMESRRKMEEVEEQLRDIAERISAFRRHAHTLRKGR